LAISFLLLVCLSYALLQNAQQDQDLRFRCAGIIVLQ
jgi:hypothetical protein